MNFGWFIARLVTLSGRALACAAGRVAGLSHDPMKLVVALIKPFKLEEVKEALARIGLEGMVVAEVKGFGHQKGHTEIFRGTQYTVDFHPRVRIEVAVADDQKDKVVQTIVQTARTGSPGDGRVFVLPLEEVTRIDNAQQGPAAL